MPEYLATARNTDGKTVTERVDAASADAAVGILWDRGYDEVVLHTDDVMAQPLVMRTEGLLRVEEGNAREARDILEEAYPKVERFGHASPWLGFELDKMHAALALACAAEGISKQLGDTTSSPGPGSWP